MSSIKSVCVYCGSSATVDDLYKNTAKDLGARLAQEERALVYGGGAAGLMGMAADSALAGGGRVIGVFPEFLSEFEKPHNGLTEIHLVESMHQRKQKMVELSDGFVVLPGGFGTLDEFFEILTWRQLQLHDKPIFLVNVEGYWDPLLVMLERIFEKSFAQERHKNCFVVVPSIDDLMGIIGRVGHMEAIDKAHM